jgi:two-component system cell cycle response regulator DivK
MTVRPSTVTAPPLVLIVDDNERNRRLAGEVLRAAGLRTIDAASGCEGIAVAVARQPDVILLDLRLPDIDGTEVASRLRGDARTSGIPIVAVSALRHASESGSLQAAGFAGYVEKPIDVRAFPEQVRGYCRRPGA